MTFNKNFITYDNSAIVQKKVAANLIEYMEKDINLIKNMNKVIELGCGTGIFIRKLLEKYTVNHLILNDFFDVKFYINDINYNEFIMGDIENIVLPKSDIILSSSVFQWVKSFEKLISNISTSCKYLCFSIYTKGNLKEIDEHFNISLNYYDNVEINRILKKYFKEVKFTSETITLDFTTPIEALKHLKNTGVTGFKKTNIKKIRSFNSCRLTYEVSYFIGKN